MWSLLFKTIEVLSCLQVESLHSATEKFITLIPLLISNEDIDIAKVDWKRETIDVPVDSKLRILAGKIFLEKVSVSTLCTQYDQLPMFTTVFAR